MRVGICAYWFNRGQGVVARQIRSALDELGHDTFVLARPTRAGNIRPAFVDHSGVWDQPGVTDASQYRIPRVGDAGAATIGRFVWEQFSREHVEPAKRALDVVYSLTAAEQQRYADMGIESPRVRWGIHPELLRYADDERQKEGARLYFYPAGFL